MANLACDCPARGRRRADAAKENPAGGMSAGFRNRVAESVRVNALGRLRLGRGGRVEFGAVELDKLVHVGDDHAEETVDRLFVLVVAADCDGHRDVAEQAGERELHIGLVLHRPGHEAVDDVCVAHLEGAVVHDADVAHADEGVEVADLDCRFADGEGEDGVCELEERQAVEPHIRVVLALPDRTEHLDEGVVDGLALALGGALHEPCVVGEPGVEAGVDDVAAQVNHAGDREAFVVAEHAYLVERADIEREHEVVDGDAESLPYLAEVGEELLAHLATADARHILGRGRSEGEVVLVLDLADVLVKTSRDFLFLGGELGIDLVVAAAAGLDFQRSVAVEELVVVFGELFHEVLEVAAVHAHVVDDHAKRGLAVAVEERHLVLDIAFDGNGLADERVDVRLEVDAVAHGEDVVDLVVLDFPVRLDDIAVE